jgi:hypothetical protein
LDLDAIVAAITRHVDSEFVLVRSCDALVALIDGDVVDEDDVIDKGCDEAIIAMMRRHVDSPVVLEACCDVLCRIAIVGPVSRDALCGRWYRHCALGDGAIHAQTSTVRVRLLRTSSPGTCWRRARQSRVLQALMKHASAPSMAVSGCSALLAIATDDAMRAVIVAADGVDVMAKCAWLHAGRRGSNEMVASALRVLHRIARAAITDPQLAIMRASMGPSMVRWVLAAMHQTRKFVHAGAQRAACEALCGIAECASDACAAALVGAADSTALILCCLQCAATRTRCTSSALGAGSSVTSRALPPAALDTPARLRLLAAWTSYCRRCKRISTVRTCNSMGAGLSQR